MPLDAEMHVVGIVAIADLVRGWRLATRGAIRRLGRASRETVLLEEAVAAGSRVDGVPVGQIAWPRGAVLIAVHRARGLAYPGPDTQLHAGDVLSVLARRGTEAALRELVGGAPAAVGDGRPS